MIKTKRIEKQGTQEEVAERVDIGRSTLSLLERAGNISLSNLLKVMRLLEVLYVFNQFFSTAKKQLNRSYRSVII